MRVAGVAAVLFLALAAPAPAAPSLVKLADFTEPTYATSPAGIAELSASRVFVTEKPGRVRLVLNDALQAQPFLDLGAITLDDYEERGLLSVAFPPDYATSGRFYVYLTARAAAAASGTDGELQIREYRRSAANPNLADAASGRLLISIPHPDDKNHDGGQLQFGPDGKLWTGTGDGGGADNQYGHSQDAGSLLGKLLRFDPLQTPPTPEQLARGLRNPWRFSFDRATGQLVIADVGQGQREEVDVGLAANYGWPCKEGTLAYKSEAGCNGVASAAPVLERPHTGGVCSITGGYVVRDPGLPTLLGRYLYGDFCAPALRSANLANAATDAPVGLSVASLSSFGEDACGRIFVVSLAGPVYRLVDGAPSPCNPGAPPTGAPGPADTRACTLSVRVTGLRSVRRRHRLSVALRADEACRTTVSARIKGVAGFRTVTRSLTAGRRTAIALRLTRRGQRAVRHALRRHHSLRAALHVQAVDAAGNLATLARGYRIRR